ncbi:hypothetical protein MKX50_01150 [Paenibacillus sp. FSL W8-0186]|uniref:Uncharacterized protein n=1 Tax=Paenibacillus woosongensis TaxID=307580 RepID=A0ABQ4MY22_9BACL|nr:hypothetical protein [Paenibacillus woosongensis]GIP60834.1 hypothetical protein J15TS10_46480 [Paenibacillus woosongensis]
MRCGEKCFLVTYEIGGEQRVAPVTARTPVEARKKLRRTIGAEPSIIAVRRDSAQ